MSGTLTDRIALLLGQAIVRIEELALQLEQARAEIENLKAETTTHPWRAPSASD